MSGVKIELMENGYEVCYDDPEIIAKNRASKDKWIDPEREYVFKTSDEVLEFVGKLLPKLGLKESEDTTFSKEFKSMTNNEESD